MIEIITFLKVEQREEVPGETPELSQLRFSPESQ
jgi:hypothetical protein